MSKRTAGYTAFVAIVRVTIDSDAPLKERITVTKLVSDFSVAEAEVARLQELNGAKGCEYFATPTRLHANISNLGE